MVAHTAVGTSQDDHYARISACKAEGLVRQGCVTAQALAFLRACVQARLNLAISGPPGSGKRSLLYALVFLADPDGQILAIQNPDEPALERKGVTTLRANLDPSQGHQRITRHYLLSIVPKMQPQGLVLDRVDGAEAVPLLKLLLAMNGVIFSVVAESPEDTLGKLESWGLLHGNGLDSRTIRRILSTSLDLIIQLVKSDTESPVVASLTEVMEFESDTPTVRDIFLLQDVHRHEAGRARKLRPTGSKPQFLDRLKVLGISLPKDVFV